LVFDSKLTTYPVLDELAARGITFLTLRQRGPKVLETLAALPQGSGHGVYSVVALRRLACMFVAGGVVFVPIVRYN
jgi:hypothetical protein